MLYQLSYEAITVGSRSILVGPSCFILEHFILVDKACFFVIYFCSLFLLFVGLDRSQNTKGILKCIQTTDKANTWQEQLTSSKMWAYMINKTNPWSRFVQHKTSSFIHFKRSGLKPPELIQFYRTCIRPITEYASPAFHDCLPAYLSKDIESIQRRAMRISFPSLSYKEALVEAGLISLSVRRQSLTDKLFTKVTTDRENKLHHLLPEQRTCHYNLRNQRRFKPVFKTNRCKSSFIIHNSQKLFN